MLLKELARLDDTMILTLAHNERVQDENGMSFRKPSIINIQLTADVTRTASSNF